MVVVKITTTTYNGNLTPTSIMTMVIDPTTAWFEAANADYLTPHGKLRSLGVMEEVLHITSKNFTVMSASSLRTTRREVKIFIQLMTETLVRSQLSTTVFFSSGSRGNACIGTYVVSRTLFV